MTLSETKPTYAARMIDLEADYDTVAPWWPAHGWAAVPRNILPRLGVMIEIAGRPAAAAWLYMDNSIGVGMMEWAVTNPANTPRESLKACTMLVDCIRDCAAQNDYGVVLTSAKQPALIRLYEKAGFQKTDEGMAHLIMLTKE